MKRSINPQSEHARELFRKGLNMESIEMTTGLTRTAIIRIISEDTGEAETSKAKSVIHEIRRIEKKLFQLIEDFHQAKLSGNKDAERILNDQIDAISKEYSSACA